MFKRLAKQLTVIVINVALIATALAEEGCPPNKLPSEGDGCVNISTYTKLPLDASKPMKFDAIQISMTTIFIQATGTITNATPDDFEAFMASDGAKMTKMLFLHSPGGNLLAGLRLGEKIRKHGLSTYIGRTIPLDGVMAAFHYKDAMCISACAYAFLGGVSRHFSEEDLYGVHRFGTRNQVLSGDEAQIISSILSDYLQKMDVDQLLLKTASLADFRDNIYPVSVTEAKKMRVIFDPSGLTSFVVEDMHGLAVAVFKFTKRERHFAGTVFCNADQPALLIYDLDDTVPIVLRSMVDFPAEFNANGMIITGKATYLKPDQQRKIGALFFELPGLNATSFSGTGLSLESIKNGNNAVMSTNTGDLASIFAWIDAISSLSFEIVADNGERTLPLVLRECQK
jgi:hypothetical protein